MNHFCKFNPNDSVIDLQRQVPMIINFSSKCRNDINESMHRTLIGRIVGRGRIASSKVPAQWLTERKSDSPSRKAYLCEILHILLFFVERFPLRLSFCGMRSYCGSIDSRLFFLSARTTNFSIHSLVCNITEKKGALDENADAFVTVPPQAGRLQLCENRVGGAAPFTLRHLAPAETGTRSRLTAARARPLQYHDFRLKHMCNTARSACYRCLLLLVYTLFALV